MPELPEVEFCRQSLSRWAQGKRILSFEILDGRSIRASMQDRPSQGLPEASDALQGVFRHVAGPLQRHGKRLLWTFGDQALLLHLGMTGKWSRRPSPYAKLRLDLETGPLYFIDPRLLGGVVPTTAVEGRRLLKLGLGPDALGNPLPILKGTRAIKVALMDQSVVAGLGNVQAMEALWRAHLHPATPAMAVVGERHAQLSTEIQTQLQFTLKMLQDADEITYVEEAGADNPFPLYQRSGSPCSRCQTIIERMVQGGRSTYWCPGCQPILAT